MSDTPDAPRARTTVPAAEPNFGGEIPGSRFLGWGFDIFGSYDTGSVMNRLLRLPTRQDKTILVGDTKYLVPDDVTPHLEAKTFGEGRAFSSRKKVQEFFSAEAKLEASYGGFSGQFEGSYSHASQSDVHYMYGLYRGGRRAWALDLDNPSERDLTDAVRQDPVYADLPSEYDKSNEWRFFAFFDKYGTHFLRRVEVGFRFLMTTSVLKTYSKDETEIKAKMELQYKAVFGAKAEASSRWKQLGEGWSASSSTKIAALGGDSSLLDAVALAPGENFEETYHRWRESADRSPAIIGFHLKPIWHLFEPKRAAALEEAFGAYLRNRIYIEAKQDFSLIMVRGEPIVPQKDRPDPAHHGGFQVAILDRKNLSPVVSEYVDFTWASPYFSPDWRQAWDRLAGLLAQHRKPEYLVILASWNLQTALYPTEKLYTELISIGAGKGLDEWHEHASSQYAKGLNYCLIGVPTQGLGAGHEALSRAPSLVRATPAATLQVEIQRLAGEAEERGEPFTPLTSRQAA